MQLFDTHRELVLQPYKKGVKLVKPVKHEESPNSIKSTFDLPVSVYFLNRNSSFVDGNHLTLLTALSENQGYASTNDLVGKNIQNILQIKHAEKLINTNNHILNHRKEMTIIEESILRTDGIDFEFISFKFPLYNTDDILCGLFGFSILTDTTIFPTAEILSNCLDAIIKTGLLTQENDKPVSKDLLPGCKIDGAYLSSQEVKCLRLVIAGKTNKMIGKILGLSPRTIEHYLENIKIKLDVRTKSELIEKIVQYLWPEMFLQH